MGSTRTTIDRAPEPAPLLQLSGVRWETLKDSHDLMGAPDSCRAIRHNILDKSARVLVIISADVAHRKPRVLGTWDDVFGARESAVDVYGMKINTRTVRRYDHRLRDLVRSTGDIAYATRLGVPGSTARGWLRSERAEVVSHHVVDLDSQALQVEVVRLRKRVATLTALIRVIQAPSFSPDVTAELLLTAADEVDGVKPTLLADGEVENFNSSVDQLVDSGLLNRLLADRHTVLELSDRVLVAGTQAPLARCKHSNE